MKYMLLTWIAHVWHMKERHMGGGRSMQGHACQARIWIACRYRKIRNNELLDWPKSPVTEIK